MLEHLLTALLALGSNKLRAALTMLGVKALKILPGIPFMPGYKGVILIPLYLVAARVTRTRFGATLTGLTMGTVAFLLGDGRYDWEYLPVTPGFSDTGFDSCK